MDNREAELKELELRLISEYGELLTSKEVAVVLRFHSHDALLKARQEGRLPVRMI